MAKPKAEIKDTAVFAQVDRSMKRQLEDLARRRDVPVSQLIREAIRGFLEKAA